VVVVVVVVKALRGRSDASLTANCPVSATIIVLRHEYSHQFNARFKNIASKDWIANSLVKIRSSFGGSDLGDGICLEPRIGDRKCTVHLARTPACFDRRGKR
jgi:hypothetical protein